MYFILTEEMGPLSSLLEMMMIIEPFGL